MCPALYGGTAVDLGAVVSAPPGRRPSRPRGLLLSCPSWEMEREEERLARLDPDARRERSCRGVRGHGPSATVRCVHEGRGARGTPASGSAGPQRPRHFLTRLCSWAGAGCSSARRLWLAHPTWEPRPPCWHTLGAGPLPGCQEAAPGETRGRAGGGTEGRVLGAAHGQAPLGSGGCGERHRR